MDRELSLAEGKELIKLARRSIAYFLASGRKLNETTEKKRLLEKRGCFVTLHSFPDKELRGCIGFPYPIMPLWNAAAEAAVQAAFHDPRFPQLQSSEIEQIVLEVSVLTPPEEMKGEKKKIAENIRIGKDGLIVKRGPRSGLLLPIVPVTHQWDAQTLLEQTCVKAGLPETAWRATDTQIFKFQSQVFEEETPNGKIKEIHLTELMAEK
jgi:hypothetical protein